MSCIADELFLIASIPMLSAGVPSTHVDFLLKMPFFFRDDPDGFASLLIVPISRNKTEKR